MSIAKKISEVLDMYKKGKRVRSKNIILKKLDNDILFLQIEDDLVKIRLELFDFDKMGYSIKTLDIKDTHSSPDEHWQIGERIKYQATELSQKLTYLLEDLRIVEIDYVNHNALLRSYPPQVIGNDINYYEIIIQNGIHFGYGTSISFVRYSYKQDQNTKQIIETNLTTEVFERLIQNLRDLIESGHNPMPNIEMQADVL